MEPGGSMPHSQGLSKHSSRGQPTRSGPPARGFGVRLTTSHCKNKGVQKRHTRPRNWMDNLEHNRLRIIKSRRLRWSGHVSRMGEDRNGLKILTGKPTGTRPLGRPRRKSEDNI